MADMSSFLFQKETMSSLKDSFTLFAPFFIFTLLVPFFIFVVFAFTSWPFNRSKILKNLPPSPSKLPIIGNLHQLGSNPQRSLKSLADKHGPVMLLHLCSKPALVISSADAAREVMKTHDVAFANRPKSYFAGRLLYQFRDVTFSPYGEYWRQIRSVCVLQLLSNKRVQSFRGIREEEIAAMIEKIGQSRASSSIIDADEMFSTLTNDIVCRAVFGRKYSGEEGGSKFKELFKDFSYLLGAFNVGDYMPWLAWVNHINGLEAKVNQVARDLDEYLEHVIDDERKRQEKGGNGENLQNFARVLLEVQRTNASGFAMDNNCIKATLLDMIVGGTDTTHALLQWVMTELLRNKNAMTKLQKEVREVLGSKADITDEDLEKMKYLQAVIKETLRLHPSVPLLVPREARKDVNLMGYDVAKGTQVIVNAWALGRDPSFWDEAEEFKPERFLNSSLDFKGLNFQYIPFGSGRRSCPGSTFALGMAELALANLMHKFNFALPNGVRAEDLDMTEAAGIITQKKIPLPVYCSSCSKLLKGGTIGKISWCHSNFY